jgi:2-keto-4-pentenoate hydratase/2-oxohepta-3-ene-1,7-dioic acid hydratase in catechol pathway
MTIERYARVTLDNGASVYARLENGTAVLYDGAPWHGGAPDGSAVPLERAALLCPVEPTKILGIGRNYVDHAKELGSDVPSEPLMFLKPPSALLAPGGTVLLPPESVRVDHEGELGVVIGRRCRRVSREAALDVIFGYTIVCDVTARDLQVKDGQWSRAKGFDGFCPVGPHVVRSVDPSALGLRVEVSGSVRQDGNTRDMMFGIAELIAHISAAMTLEPGDLIATGTPQGVGPLKAGDHVVVRIDQLGALEFDVKSE